MQDGADMVQPDCANCSHSPTVLPVQTILVEQDEPHKLMQPVDGKLRATIALASNRDDSTRDQRRCRRWSIVSA